MYRFGGRDQIDLFDCLLAVSVNLLQPVATDGAGHKTVSIKGNDLGLDEYQAY